MTAVAWTIAASLFVSDGQTRSTPGWHLPVTIEVIRDVEIKPTLGVSHEARGTLYSWSLPSSKPVRITSGERFQMVKVYEEGACRIRFKNRNYDVTSCHWLPRFTDSEANIYLVLTPPRTSAGVEALKASRRSDRQIPWSSRW
jgi:hypothetical protein